MKMATRRTAIARVSIVISLSLSFHRPADVSKCVSLVGSNTLIENRRYCLLVFKSRLVGIAARNYGNEAQSEWNINLPSSPSPPFGCN